MSHLRLEEIEAFLRGDGPADESVFRRHVADCAECAARLAEEARVDEVLAGAAATLLAAPAVAPIARPAFRWRFAWTAAAAVLAVVLAFAAGVLRRNPVGEANPQVAVDATGPAAAAADPATTDPRVDLAAARTVAPDAMGAWTTIGDDRLTLAPAPPID